MKKILVRIEKKTGKVQIETQGYQGAECLEATKKLEEGLGLTDPQRDMKPEFYQQAESEGQNVGS